MAESIFISRKIEWLAEEREKVERAVSKAAQHIEITIKTSGLVPRRDGILQGSVYHKKVAESHYQVIAPQVYAAYQERGMREDGTHVVENYTTGGTGPHWFRFAIDANKEDIPDYLRGIGSGGAPE